MSVAFRITQGSTKCSCRCSTCSAHLNGTFTTMPHEPLGAAAEVALHPSHHIDAHLPEQIEDIERHPVLADQPLVVEVEIHHPHGNGPARRSDPEEVVARMHGEDARPASGDGVGAVAD